MREFYVTRRIHAEQIRNQGVSFREATLYQRSGPNYPPAIVWLGRPGQARAKVLYRHDRILSLEETLSVLGKVG